MYIQFSNLYDNLIEFSIFLYKHPDDSLWITPFSFMFMQSH